MPQRATGPEAFVSRTGDLGEQRSFETSTSTLYWKVHLLRLLKLSTKKVQMSTEKCAHGFRSYFPGQEQMCLEITASSHHRCEPPVTGHEDEAPSTHVAGAPEAVRCQTPPPENLGKIVPSHSNPKIILLDIFS